MLSQSEVVFYQNRISEILSQGQLTEWQRSFLNDIGRKISRYGVRTQLSEKQLAMLQRLTRTHVKQTVTAVNSPGPRPSKAIAAGTSRSGDRTVYRRPVYKIKNPLRPPWILRHLTKGSLSLQPRGWIVIAFTVVLTAFAASFTSNKSSSVSADPTASTPPAASESALGADVAGKVQFTVTDGDTIRLGDGRRVRLIGFNTPEKFQPLCSAEAALGQRASARLQKLVATARVTNVTLVPCACKPGTEGTRRCNHGRSCGRLFVDGQDVGQTLIAEGLAVPFQCGSTGCPPAPRPWCE